MNKYGKRDQRRAESAATGNRLKADLAKKPGPAHCHCGAPAKFQIGDKMVCGDHAEVAGQKFISVPIIKTK
jgi:hypothetical protein